MRIVRVRCWVTERKAWLMRDIALYDICGAELKQGVVTEGSLSNHDQADLWALELRSNEDDHPMITDAAWRHIWKMADPAAPSLERSMPYKGIAFPPSTQMGLE